MLPRAWNEMHSHQRCKLIDALALFMAWGAVAFASARVAAWHLSSQLNLQTCTARAAMAPKRAREAGTTANKPSKSAKAAQPLPDIEDFSPSNLQQVCVCPVPFHSVCYQLRSIQAIVLGGQCRVGRCPPVCVPQVAPAPPLVGPSSAHPVAAQIRASLLDWYDANHRIL